jgi:hypothetical protein
MAESNPKYLAGGVVLCIIAIVIGAFLITLEPSFAVCSISGGVIGAFMGGGLYLIYCGATGKQPKW